MKITPRKEEVAAVIEVLESDEYKNAEAMAKALIKTVADMLDMRDWYALGHRFNDTDPYPLAWGPFGSESDAQSVAKKSSLGGTWMTKKLYSPGVLTGRIEGKPGGGSGFCTQEGCGHSDSLHHFQASARGKCAVCEVCPKYRK